MKKLLFILFSLVFASSIQSYFEGFIIHIGNRGTGLYDSNYTEAKTDNTTKTK